MLQKKLYPLKIFVLAIINSYAQMFFSNNILLGVLLLFVSFFNPYAGFTGLLTTITAIVFAKAVSLNSDNIKKGLYSYNAFFVGLGMGTFFNYGWALFVLAIIMSIFCVVLAVVLQNLLSKYKLPFLSLPFVISFWLILLVTKEFTHVQFTTRNIYWLNEMYSFGDAHLVKFVLFFEHLKLPSLIDTFFRALSSLFFQSNILAGIIISIAIFLHSRILFSLLLLGFFTAYGFNILVHAYDKGMNIYLLGGNYILTAVALGGFFIIPNKWSYLIAAFSVTITFLVAIGIGKLAAVFLLPVYSLPFCIVVITAMYFINLLFVQNKIVITQQQFYSPEKNLYHFLNNKYRSNYSKYYRIKFPFLGSWMVSQAYDGNITHKGDWSKALDFIIVDNQLKTYNNYGTKPEDFYCFNKPVIAPAAGWVVQVVKDIVDNEIGSINQTQNWGNSIVIKHAEGLFSKLSHLKRNSIKVNVGQFVQQGEIIALCGNSGRSPEPHLHFQLQTTPYIGSKTLHYPIAQYYSGTKTKKVLQEYNIPKQAEIVENANSNECLWKAFNFQPGIKIMATAQNVEDEEWEVLTDAYNKNYITCQQTNSIAYFLVYDGVFMFTQFIGNSKGLLYTFYRACYKVNLSLPSTENSFVDNLPLQFKSIGLLSYLQDFFAPFYIFTTLQYESKNKLVSNDVLNTTIQVDAIDKKIAAKKIQSSNQYITTVIDGEIKKIESIIHRKKIEILCHLKNI